MGTDLRRAVHLAAVAVLLLMGGCGAGASAQPVELHPEQFGAIGDGKADDAEAFARAITRLAATGGGILRGRPGAVYRITKGVNLTDLSNVQLIGNGATIFRYTPGTASNALSVYGSENILIEGWSFDSSYNAFQHGSTGSNPNILLGVGASGPNRNITVRGNRFNNGNHSNITVGMTNVEQRLPPGAFGNENIRIEDNRFGNAAGAVFIYKATRGFSILRNVGSNFSVSALGLDTHAATDRDRGNYEIRSGEIRGNAFRGINAARAPRGITENTPGRPKAFAARGLVLKGGIHDVVVDGNQFREIRSVTNVDTFGILVIKDQAPRAGVGSRLTITNNIVEDVSADGPGATGAWAMVLGPGYSGVLIQDNSFKNAERGVRLSAKSAWSFLSNRLENLALSWSFPLHIDGEPATVGSKTIRGNSFIRGRGRAPQAIDVTKPIPSLRIGTNELIGFAAERL